MTKKEKVLCPSCGLEITSDRPLWVWKRKWYCTEYCVRRAMGKP